MTLVQPVSVDEVPNGLGGGSRSRVSVPILEEFFGAGHICVKVNRGTKQATQLIAALNAYIRSYSLPARAFRRQGEVYLMRLEQYPQAASLADLMEKKNANGTVSST